MDYFYVGNGHGNVGLVDLNVRTNFKVGEKSGLSANLHYFMSPVAIEDPTNAGQTLSNTLGTELDLVYGIKLHNAVNLKIGYSHMFATKSMIEVKGTGDSTATNNWTWLMLAIKPTLFESKKKEDI